VDLSVAQGRRTDPSHLAPALAVGVVAFALARLALLPGVAFWDTGEFQTVGPVLGTAHPTGFPTYVLLGWLASVLFQPFGEPALRMNLLSAVCLGVATAVTVDLVRALTRSVWLGIAGGLGLALTPIAWSIGTHADPHVLHLTLVAILLRLLVGWEDRVRGGDRTWSAPDAHADRWLVGAAIVFGLAMGNHSLTLLLGIPVGMYVLAVEPGIIRRPRLILTCVVALVATLALVYLELPLRAGPFRAPLVYGHPETWEGFWYVALAEQFRGSLQDPFGDIGGKVAALARLTYAQFGILAPVIPIALIVTAMRRPRYALLTGTTVLITCWFAASYINADISRYYLGPALMAWTWLAILGALLVDAVGVDTSDSLRHRPTLRSAVALLVAIALVAPALVAVRGSYASVDVSGDHKVMAWNERVLGLLEPNAMVVSWWSYSTPLWYAQIIEGRRPDIFIVDDRTRLDQGLGSLTEVIDANLGSRPVYAMRQDPREVLELKARYITEDLTSPEDGLLMHVVARRAIP
jgi:Protein O-mannosyl-transferase TMEM260-like